MSHMWEMKSEFKRKGSYIYELILLKIEWNTLLSTINVVTLEIIWQRNCFVLRLVFLMLITCPKILLNNITNYKKN